MRKLLITFTFLLIILSGCNNDKVTLTGTEEIETAEIAKPSLEENVINEDSNTKIEDKEHEMDLSSNEGDLLIDIDVYVNDVLLDVLVYQNIHKVNEYDNLSDYVQAQPVMDYLGITYSIDSANDRIILKSGKYINTERAFSRVAKFIEDELYIAFSVFRLHTEGSLKQDDDTAMYLYTSDYERNDIPSTLDECYKMLDQQLDEGNIEFIKNSTEEDRINMHMGLGMWIRNEWLYPAQSKIAYMLQENGLIHPDDMSAIIIEGYYRYLNNEKCSLDDLIDWYFIE